MVQRSNLCTSVRKALGSTPTRTKILEFLNCRGTKKMTSKLYVSFVTEPQGEVSFPDRNNLELTPSGDLLEIS